MRVKISEVATAAGVSAATVSKVLSGRPGYTVNVSTAERVREAARTLGYVPDVAARNLRTRRTGQLGVILEAVGASEPEDLTDGVNAAAVRRTFDGAIMAGLSGAARDLGVPALVVYPGGNVPPESFLDGRVDGLLVSCNPLRGHELLHALAAARLPVVALWTQQAPPGLSAVDVDHRAGTRQATRHLLDLGHRHIVFYGAGRGSQVEHFRRREDGYRDALEQAGLSPRPALHGGPDLIAQVQRDGVTGVIAETDLAAAAAFHALREAGLRVPEDVSLVGFDDILGAEYIAGGLTTVYHPAAEMAAGGVAALMRRMEGGPVTQTLLPTHLVRRQSTSAPRR